VEKITPGRIRGLPKFGGCHLFPGWQALAGCAVILLVKRAAWLPGLVVMIVALVAVGRFCMFRRREAERKWGRRLAWPEIRADHAQE